MSDLDAELALVAKNDQLDRHVTQLRDVLWNALRLVRLGAWGTTCDACGSKPGKPCYGNGPMAIGHQGRNDKAVRELEEILAEACDVL
jgi:hypothetical protein